MKLRPCLIGINVNLDFESIVFWRIWICIQDPSSPATEQDSWIQDGVNQREYLWVEKHQTKY